MNVYEISTIVRLKVSFFDTDGVTLADPTTITVYVKDPAGVETPYTYAGNEVKKDVVGKYYFDLPVDSKGKWKYKWKGTGTIQATTPDIDIYINESELL